MPQDRIGLIGAGLMGAGIANSLIKQAYSLTVLAHRNREPIDKLVQLGAIEAHDADLLTRTSDVIILCLPGAPEVTTTIDLIFNSLRSGQMIIDTTTSTPETTEKIANRLFKIGVSFIDAPITGGPKLAHEGKLISMIGARAEDQARATNIISKYSIQVEHMGTIGAGNRAKLINNLMTVGSAALVIEAYRKAREDGLDWHQLYGFMHKGFARSGMQDLLIKPELDGIDSGYKFSLKNATKDLNYIKDYIESDDIPRPALRGLVDFYQTACDVNGDDAYVRDLLDQDRELRPKK